ncbi:MAG: hypothetical protein ACYTAS_00470 [Planctomycetota bacterium]|jgi:hypothetical protein
METKKHRYQLTVKVMGLGLLFVLQTVMPVVMRTLGGTPWGWIGGGVISGPIGFLFWTTLCLCWWRMMKLPPKWMTLDNITWSALVLLPVVLIGGRAIYRSWPSVRAARILANCELASLPPSAREIRVFTWSNGFNGEWRLRFRADRADIERFLEASPILKGAESRVYSRDRMRLAEPDGYWEGTEDDPNGPDYFRPCFNMPPWYIQEIKEPGKRYETRPSGFSDPGEVIVHTEEDLVFVGLSHG